MQGTQAETARPFPPEYLPRVLGMCVQRGKKWSFGLGKELEGRAHISQGGREGYFRIPGNS